MLCIRIVFTEDETEELEEVSSYVSQRFDESSKAVYDGITVLSLETEDENLYELCQYMCSVLFRKKADKKVRKHIKEYYNCFNSDECKLILNNVLKADVVSEIPGRLYIYFKINTSINPSGFFEFMCKDIFEALKDSAIEEAERIIAMNDNNDFIEVLKCFSGLSPECAERVEISADSTGLKICSCIPENENNMAEYASDDAEVLSELIALNPKRIVVCDKKEFLKNDISSVIIAVFDGRIEYTQ